MTYFDDIYEIAVDNHYLITTKQAADSGVPPVELAKLSQRKKLEHIGHGLYRIARYVPHEDDPYAVAVARLGEGAYLYGESVLALLKLAPTDPSVIYVASPHRVRRALPQSLRIKKPGENDAITAYNAIPCQDVATALRAARYTMMDERLREAAQRAREGGYLTERGYRAIEEEMGWR